MISVSNVLDIELIDVGGSDVGFVRYHKKIVVTGLRIAGEGQDDDGNKRAESYAAEIASAQDYYPFGQTMPDRSMTNTVLLDGDHRFGFNGKEQDNSNEWGRLTHYDYGFRIYNPGIAKFLSVDPLTSSYPMLTPYQFASNRPIDGIDLDGLEYKNANDQWQYDNYLGGSAIQISDNDWVLINTAEGYKQYYNTESGWSKKIEYHAHLQGPDGLNVAENYQTSQYADPISSAAFIGIGGALMAPIISGISGGGLSNLGSSFISGTKTYLTSYYSTNFGSDLKEAAWDIQKDITHRGNIELDKMVYNFLPIPKVFKGGVKSFLDSRLDFNVSKLDQGGVTFEWTKRKTTGYDIGRAFGKGILDIGASKLKGLGGSNSTNFMINGGKRTLENLFDSIIQQEQDKSEEGTNKT